MRREKRFWWLIDQIKKNGYQIGAEVGCLRGQTSYRLLKACPQLKLICVDLWKYDPSINSEYTKDKYPHWDFVAIKTEFDRNIEPFSNRTIVLQGVSWEMADKVEDNSLDFVFIDADHAYEAVKKDIMAWSPKLRPGGMLSGHDINIDGVQKAVKELTRNWIDTRINQVWYCKKEDCLGL